MSPGAAVIQAVSNSYRLPASLLAPCLHNKVSAITAPIRGVSKVPLHSCGVLQKQASYTTLGGWLENAGAGRPVYCSAGDLRQSGRAHTFEAEATNTAKTKPDNNSFFQDSTCLKLWQGG